VAGIAVGQLTDRVGARGLLSALLIIAAAAVLAHVLVASFLTFVVVVGAYQFADRGAAAVRGALIARAVAADQQVRTRSALRAISNIGFTMGTGLAAIALATGARAAFVALIVVAAAGYLVAALIISFRVPAITPVPRESRISIVAVASDHRFMVFAAVNAVLSLQFAVLEFGMPLWVARSTAAPPWMVTVLFVVNTVLVTALQIRIGRSSETWRGAIRATAIAGGLLAIACVLFGAASLTPAIVSVVLLAGAGIAHAFGEMMQGASSWSIAYELSPAHAHGQYQGMFATSSSVGLVAGSSVIALIALDNGLIGWLALGSVFLLAGSVAPLVLRRPDVAGTPTP
jgi:MFS family permease